MKILIVDDSRTDLSILNSTIGDIEEIETYFAFDADSAIRLAIEIEPDLIVLDVVMPIMNGIEVSERLQRSPSTADIPIVFVTACELSEKECYRVGCIAYLTKPINKDKLKQIIVKQSFITKLEHLMNENRKFSDSLSDRGVVAQ